MHYMRYMETKSYLTAVFPLPTENGRQKTDGLKVIHNTTAREFHTQELPKQCKILSAVSW